MAHKLTKRGQGEADDQNKQLLNRREYVKAGAAATALMIGAGAGLTGTASGNDSSSFATGFSEYTQ